MKNLYKFRKKTNFLLFFSLLFSGCAQGKIDPFDRHTGATRSEITKTLIGERNQKEKKASALIPTPLPSSSKMLSLPLPPEVGGDKLISFSVTEQVPLKDVLIEIGRVAKLDTDIDPQISGGVIINAKNRPLKEILERICDMGNVRYTYNNGVLRFEKDTPYSKNYLVDFLINGELWNEVTSNAEKIVSTSSDSSTGSSSASISVNKSAGIITVFASNKKQKEVSKYLEEVRKNSSLQVLIEAKVVEVTLNDSYQTGIDWSWTNNAAVGTGSTAASITGSFPATDKPLSLILSKKLFGGSLSTTITALEQFGTVKAVASPRINALNNQKATLNFTKKLVYFTNDASTSTTTTTGVSNTQNSVTSTKHEEATGTELTIIPSIDAKTNEITLNVQPKISIQTGTVTQQVLNPSAPAGSSGQFLTNTIPIINSRELNTTAKIQSGNILVIGGVMTEDTSNTDRGFPYLSRIPLLGNLFKSVSKISSITETVIFIKATVISSGNGVSSYDREIDKKFTSSSRPFL